MSKYEPYKFALVGSSGRGKTYSFRNMNPDTCGFINVENKPLPFINKFKHYALPNDWKETYDKLIKFAKMSEITEVVFDSFSAYVDSLMKYCRQTKKGFEVFNEYNAKIGELLYIIKKYPKEIIMTAHYDWVEGESGVLERAIAVKGNEWKGKIEKEFTLVNYADVRVVNEKRNYTFILNSDGTSTAKTPPMFLKAFDNKEEIPNDANELLNSVRKILKQ
jgi:hypothetical protein